MQLKIFSLYDEKIDAYMQPFFFPSKGHAVRAITDFTNDSSTSIGKYPEDFTLYELGEWDDGPASFSIHEHQINLGKAIEFKIKEIAP